MQMKIAALIVALAGLVSVPAFAQDNAGAAKVTISDSSTTRAKTVYYGDLDLSKVSDAQTMLRRIKSAAHEVCDEGYRTPLSMSGFSDACIAQAVTQTVASLDSPVLTALNNGTQTTAMPLT